jgi:hypothetical protein
VQRFRELADTPDPRRFAEQLVERRLDAARQHDHRTRRPRPLGRHRGPRFADAVFSGTYQPWVRFVTELAVERGVGGTPTVLVAGIPVPANPRTIAAAVAELAP